MMLAPLSASTEDGEQEENSDCSKSPTGTTSSLPSLSSATLYRLLQITYRHLL